MSLRTIHPPPSLYGSTTF
uniref:Uncharacterized protein n=1 Tax=Anguilla anguilla TaxID=7936 RepID=A0A0E9S1D8_ANGAN